MSIWEPFTERARRSIVLAQEESQRLGRDYIGTEHILLGIISENASFAAETLINEGLNLQSVRGEVEAIVGRGQRANNNEMVFTPRSKKVINLALEASKELSDNYVGTEHLLIGLIKETTSVASKVLNNLGFDGINYINNLKAKKLAHIMVTQPPLKKVNISDVVAGALNIQMNSTPLEIAKSVFRGAGYEILDDE